MRFEVQIYGIGSYYISSINDILLPITVIVILLIDTSQKKWEMYIIVVVEEVMRRKVSNIDHFKM